MGRAAAGHPGQLDAGPDRPDDGPRPAPHPDLPDGRAYGIRLSLADVKGITAAEVERIVAGRPYASLADFWHRARVSRPVVERLVVAGGPSTACTGWAAWPRGCRCAAAGR